MAESHLWRDGSGWVGFADLSGVSSPRDDGRLALEAVGHIDVEIEKVGHPRPPGGSQRGHPQGWLHYGHGGLIENNASKGQTKVPLLGDIPGLGRLFRSNNISSDKRNLVILITAKTLSSEGAPIEQIFNSRAIRGLNMPRDELPGYRDGSDPFIKPPTAKADAKAGAKPEPKLEARPGVA